MNILFLSHTYIGSPFVIGSHHISRELSEMGHTVLHIPAPTSMVHKILNKKRVGAKIGIVNKNRYQYIPSTLLPIKFILKLIRWNPFAKSIAKQIRSKMKLHNIISFDICLIDDPSFHGVQKYLDITTSIYRPTDIYSKMKGSEGFNSIEKNLLSSVQGVIATNEKIIDFLEVGKYNIPFTTIENGFEYNHFLNENPKTNTNNELITGCYVGAIDHRFDINLLINAVKNIKNIKFEIYSPTNPNSTHDRVIWKQQANYETLPQTLKEYDFLIMPFNRDPSNFSRSPMKLFEYASINTPMIIPDYFNDYNLEGVLQYKSETDLLTILKKLDTTTNIIRDQSILESHSWTNKTSTILKTISHWGKK